jgi:hypothetical protein
MDTVADTTASAPEHDTNGIPLREVLPGPARSSVDSHTPAGGAIGMLAIGAGGLEVALAARYRRDVLVFDANEQPALATTLGPLGSPLARGKGGTGRRVYCATVVRQAAAAVKRPDPWPVAGRP